MVTMSIIKAPAVDNLEVIKSIIKSLEYTEIPFSYIDERRLEELEKNGKISSETRESIDEWKKNEVLPIKKKGVIQSIVSLGKALEIVEAVKIENLDQPLGVSGPILNTFIEKSVSGLKLTKIGYDICNVIQENDSSLKFNDLIFWRFLRSNITHNFQKLIENEDAYEKGISYTLKKIEGDGISRTLFRGWARYLDLTELESDKLSKNKIVRKLVSSTIFEFNMLKPGDYSIENLEQKISSNLDLSRTLINFYLIFEIILKNKKEIEGAPSSRVENSLPNFPDINMLNIKSRIINTNIESLTESLIPEIIKIGENK